MALLLQALVALIAIALVVYEFRVARPTELRLAEGVDTRPDPSAPGGVRAGGVVALLYGFLNFPATLAPVVLVALGAQAHPIGGDGTTALIGIFVAGYSMSASLKAIRAGEIYVRKQRDLFPIAHQCVVYLLGWTAMVAALIALAPQPPAGKVAMLVYGYAAATFFAALALKLAEGRAGRDPAPRPAQDATPDAA